MLRGATKSKFFGVLAAQYLALFLLLPSAVSAYSNGQSGPIRPLDKGFECEWLSQSELNCGSWVGGYGTRSYVVRYHYKSDLSSVAKHPVYLAAPYPDDSNQYWGYLHLPNPGDTTKLVINQSPSSTVGYHLGGYGKPQAPDNFCGTNIQTASCQDAPPDAPNVPKFLINTSSGGCRWKSAARIECVRHDFKPSSPNSGAGGDTTNNAQYFYDPVNSNYSTGPWVFRTSNLGDGYYIIPNTQSLSGTSPQNAGAYLVGSLTGNAARGYFQRITAAVENSQKLTDEDSKKSIKDICNVYPQVGTTGGPGGTCKLGYDPSTTYTGSNPPGGTCTGANCVATATTQNDQCTASSFKLGWILCPLINLANDTVVWLSQAVESMLTITPLVDNSNLYALWAAILGVANIFFIIIFLIIIFANTLSLNIDAYTIKKTLPRLVAAVILVQFSFLLCKIFVDVGNIAGLGVKTLITTTVQNVPTTACRALATGASTPTIVCGGTHSGLSTTLGVAITSLLAIGVVAVVGVLMTLFLLFTAVLGIFSTFITLALRQLLITAFVAISPLALAAWVLPNTEDLFKKWLKNFTRLILMFPLIMGILSIAFVFTKVASNTNSISQIVAAIMPVIAFAMIPGTFKWAGGTMAAVGGVVQKRVSGAQGKLRNSQLAKDLKASKKERGFLNTQSDSRAKRALGRFQSGAFMPGRGASRRRAGGYAGALDARGKEYNQTFVNDNWGLDEDKKSWLRDVATAKNGQSVHGVKVDDAARAQAVRRMSDLADYDGVRLAKTTMGGSAAWRAGIQDKIGDLIKKAPDIVKGAPGAFNSLTPEQIADLHPSTAKRMREYFSSEPVEFGSWESGKQEKYRSEREAGRSTLLNATERLVNSPSLSGRTQVDTVKALYDLASEGHMGAGGGNIITSESAPGRPSTSRISADGKIIRGSDDAGIGA